MFYIVLCGFDIIIMKINGMHGILIAGGLFVTPLISEQPCIKPIEHDYYTLEKDGTIVDYNYIKAIDYKIVNKKPLNYLKNKSAVSTFTKIK